jgi:hypothetical protein
MNNYTRYYRAEGLHEASVKCERQHDQIHEKIDGYSVEKPANYWSFDERSYSQPSGYINDANYKSY